MGWRPSSFAHVPVAFFLSGEIEFEASDGERLRVAAGGAILLEDTTGKGHQSRVIGDVPALLAVVQV